MYKIKRKKGVKYKASRPKRKTQQTTNNCLSKKLSEGCLLGLALVQTKLSSVLNCLFQWLMSIYLEITPFLVVQITQQAVMIIYLEMLLSKSSLACRIISRGLTFKFQFIGIVAQQSLLKGHSRNK